MSDDFDAVLRQLTREMMGPSVAHMSDEELGAWMELWRAVGKAVLANEPGFPLWFIKRRYEARAQLLAVLRAKASPSRSGASPTR